MVRTIGFSEEEEITSTIMDMGEGGEKKMRRKGTLIAIRALIPCYMDE